MTGEQRLITEAEKDALATLAMHGRVLAILIPEGIPDEDVKRLSREVNRVLDEMVADRDRRIT